jgi:hypothetical protein
VNTAILGFIICAVAFTSTAFGKGHYWTRAPQSEKVLLAFQSKTSTKVPRRHCDQIARQVAHPLLQRYGIALFRIQRAAVLRAPERLQNCLGRNWFRIDIRMSGLIAQIPTQEILVKTQEGVTLEALKQITERVKFVVVAQSAARNYKIRSRQPVAEMWKIADKLANDPALSYAEVNSILIRDPLGN